MSDEKNTQESPKETRRTKAEPEQRTESVKRYIYLGPTLAGGPAKNDVFKGGIPKKYEKKFESTPEFKELFVDVATFVEVKDDADTAGTALYAAAQVVKEKGVI